MIYNCFASFVIILLEILDKNGNSESERKFLEDHGSSVFSAGFYDLRVRL